MKPYPRYITPGWTPFDPLELADLTRKIVCRKRGDVEARKYTEFYVAGVYRGIVTGCLVGCNLRCFFCWSPPSRDFPESYGKFYEPEQAVNAMEELAVKHGVRKARLSCGEPTICWDHLVQVLELIEESEAFDLFILETNGLVIGARPELVDDLREFDKLYVRVSIKGGEPRGFERRTGASAEFLDLQFRAVEAFKESGVRFHVAAMTDPRIMGRGERAELVRRLWRIDSRLALSLEEEVVDPYRTTLERLRKAGVRLRWLF